MEDIPDGFLSLLNRSENEPLRKEGGSSNSDASTGLSKPSATDASVPTWRFAIDESNDSIEY